MIQNDSGQLLRQPNQMRQLPPLPKATTLIAGTRGPQGRRGPFGVAENDGLVSVSEVRLEGAPEPIRVPVLHTFMPTSRAVFEIIRARI